MPRTCSSCESNRIQLILGPMMVVQSGQTWSARQNLANFGCMLSGRGNCISWKRFMCCRVGVNSFFDVVGSPGDSFLNIYVLLMAVMFDTQRQCLGHMFVGMSPALAIDTKSAKAIDSGGRSHLAGLARRRFAGIEPASSRHVQSFQHCWCRRQGELVGIWPTCCQPSVDINERFKAAGFAPRGFSSTSVPISPLGSNSQHRAVLSMGRSGTSCESGRMGLQLV